MSTDQDQGTSENEPIDELGTAFLDEITYDDNGDAIEVIDDELGLEDASRDGYEEVL